MSIGKQHTWLIFIITIILCHLIFSKIAVLRIQLMIVNPFAPSCLLNELDYLHRKWWIVYSSIKMINYNFMKKLSLLTTSTKFYDMEKLINNILYFPGNIIQKVYFSFVQILVGRDQVYCLTWWTLTCVPHYLIFFVSRTEKGLDAKMSQKK